MSLQNFLFLVSGIEEEFQFIPQNKTFYHGQDFLRFSCIPPKGNPTPRIHWTWNGEIVVKSMTNFAVTNYKDPTQTLFYALEIRRLSSNLAGNLSCVATNVGGSRHSKFTLTEICK